MIPCQHPGMRVAAYRGAVWAMSYRLNAVQPATQIRSAHKTARAMPSKKRSPGRSDSVAKEKAPKSSKFIASLLVPNSRGVLPKTTGAASVKAPILQHQLSRDEYRFVADDAASAISKAAAGWTATPINAQRQTEHVRRIVGMETANAHEMNRWNVQQALRHFGRSEADTGSAEVQAAVWTVRIRNMERHMGDNRKDVHNRRAYRTLIHKRAKILRYLKLESIQRYEKCLVALELKPEDVEGEIVVR